MSVEAKPRIEGFREPDEELLLPFQHGALDQQRILCQQFEGGGLVNYTSSTILRQCAPSEPPSIEQTVVWNTVEPLAKLVQVRRVQLEVDEVVLNAMLFEPTARSSDLIAAGNAVDGGFRQCLVPPKEVVDAGLGASLGIDALHNDGAVQAVFSVG